MDQHIHTGRVNTEHSAVIAAVVVGLSRIGDGHNQQGARQLRTRVRLVPVVMLVVVVM